MVAVVTGHRGFLGGHVAARLAADGWSVVGLGRPEIEIPSAAFDARLREARPRLVVHCAGPASVPASVRDPEDDRRGSVDVLAALLERLGRARLVLISSAAVYGEPPSLPVQEDAPVRPVSPYGVHRAECERLVQESGADAAVARVFSAYGEGLRRQLLWEVCRQALENGSVRLSGTGAETRDFVHARDVANAIAAIARAGGSGGRPFNVASGVELTVAEVAERVVAALRVDAEIVFTGERRPGDPAHWRADVSRLRSLGWRPEIGFAEGVRAYAAWAAGRQ